MKAVDRHCDIYARWAMLDAKAVVRRRVYAKVAHGKEARDFWKLATKRLEDGIIDKANRIIRNRERRG